MNINSLNVLLSKIEGLKIHSGRTWSQFFLDTVNTGPKPNTKQSSHKHTQVHSQQIELTMKLLAEGIYIKSFFYLPVWVVIRMLFLWCIRFERVFIFVIVIFFILTDLTVLWVIIDSVFWWRQRRLRHKPQPQRWKEKKKIIVWIWVCYCARNLKM